MVCSGRELLHDKNKVDGQFCVYFITLQNTIDIVRNTQDNEQKSGNADNRSSEGRDLSNTEDNTKASTEADNGETKELSGYQQKVSDQYNEQIKTAEKILSDAKKAKDKKLAELQKRNGLFGDIQQFAGDMFNEIFNPC